MRIYSEVYGCSANRSDSELALGLLKNAGFEIVESMEKADLNIIFTCVVKTPTANRMIHRIRELTRTGKPLIVAGCMPKTEKLMIERINPHASLLGPNSIINVVDVARFTLEGKKIVALADDTKEKVLLPKLRRNPIIDIIQIAQGCLGACSYCETKFARGRLFSYSTRSILAEICRAVRDGCKEVWLTSQDNSAYGLDIGTNIVELLEKVVELDGEFFVRVGMMNPTHLKHLELDRLIGIFNHDKIFKFLHIPIQSGSDGVLKDMKRGYTIDDFLHIVKEFRKHIPHLTLATDVIVGFPTETEEDFERTVDLLKRVKPDIVNISKFDKRPMTLASKMKQLDVKIVKRRSGILSELVKSISLEKNKMWINWCGEILIDEKGKNHTWVGRNFAYKPVVISGEHELGERVFVRVCDVTPNCLIAKTKV